MIRTFADAVSRVGSKDLASYASGRSRYISWWQRPGDGQGDPVDVLMFGHRIVRFTPDHIAVWTAGYPTPSTFDGIAAALDVARITVGTTARVPYVLGHRMTEGMMLDYAGRRQGDSSWAPYVDDWLNHELSPLADYRGARLDVVDVSEGADGALRVTVRDWTYDGRDHTPTARKLAAAYVGRPNARTRVVNRGHYPTPSEPLTTIEIGA